MTVAVDTKSYVELPSHPEDVLTPRQLELLALYASGYQFAEIGSIKFLSPLTVRNTLYLARDRAGAKTLTHLCVMCLDAGLIVRNGKGFKPVQADGIVGE